MAEELVVLPSKPPAFPPLVFQVAPPPAPATIILDFNELKSFQLPDTKRISVAPPPAPAVSSSLWSQVPSPPPLNDELESRPTTALSPFLPT